MTEFHVAKDGRPFDEEALALSAILPSGSRIGIIGSTSFWHEDSEATCVALGRRLAAIDRAVLITGGVSGVGETVSRSFLAAVLDGTQDGRVFHVLPHGSPVRDFGRTVTAGRNMQERREVLARLAVIYVAVEGGPGTEHEAAVAVQRGVPVIPLGLSGHALDLFGGQSCPTFVRPDRWNTLATPASTAEERADAAAEIVAAYLGSPRTSE